MIRGIRGRLLSSSFVEDVLPGFAGAALPPPHVATAFDRLCEERLALLGPTSTARALTDSFLLPFLRCLGLSAAERADTPGAVRLQAIAGPVALPVLIVGWGVDLDGTWRELMVSAAARDARWGLCFNGVALRFVDAQQTWTRHFLEFEIDAFSGNDTVQMLLWSIARCDTLGQTPSLLDRAVDGSAEYSADVCRALGDGVVASLRLLLAVRPHRRGPSTALWMEQCLTVVYRVLFLLFAEARGLVPVWHPIYRDRYTIEGIVSTVLARRRYRGIWQAVQAISRLAHAGCTAGELKVTAFNGRLFSPVHSAALDERHIADEVMSEAMLNLSTTSKGPNGRVRIRYGDLDVEQLGSVYEHVLEHQPSQVADAALVRTRDVRKSTGTFYTPRPMTAHLVTRTLDPLVRGRTADDILRLRVLDPAMGSGAFLVAACRYLARAAEEALVREGRWAAGDVDPGARAELRREVAQKCLFGVDLNPVAVQLARLSLWLATLAAEKPLTFLDHHLIVGDSLVGATPDDLRRQPSRTGPPQRQAAALPLFDDEQLLHALGQASRQRAELAGEPDDSAATVRAKEQRLVAIHDGGAPLGRWTKAADLWCAGWFRGKGDAPDRATFLELTDALLRGRTSLPASVSAPFLEQAAAIAQERRFLHWPLALPEVFCDESGARAPDGGFDAVIGNPPWDMVRGDSGDEQTRASRRDDARQLVDFVREAGVYRLESRGQVNRYALFLERSMWLTRAGGRIGLVLPGGFATDVGAAPLRRRLFDRARVDALVGLTNRAGIFPIHRSVRFVLMTATMGEATREVSCRFGISNPNDLDTPDAESLRRGPFVFSRSFLARVSGADDLGVPEVTTSEDVEILEWISATVPRLGSADGWNARFGRELNASDDRRAFSRYSANPRARPVLEGKQIQPFRALVEEARFQLRADAARSKVPSRPRLAYRDVASATNRLTLIAAIVPPHAVTTHTLLCLKSELPLAAQRVLCALLNSFVANYLVRLRVSTHVTAALVSNLRVPFVRRVAPEFAALARLTERLSESQDSIYGLPEYAELQACAAQLYGLTERHFVHVLETFPLIPEDVKSRALARFRGRTTSP